MASDCSVCGQRPAAYCARCSVSDDQIAAHRLTQARIDAALAVVAELREEAYRLLERAQRLERDGFSGADLRARRRALVPWADRIERALLGSDS